ncbi:MAG: hypothetical protein J2P49_07710 [Methylocapsa sp.]|nr:hypothetical protein [Methylocapsa sp.]
MATKKQTITIGIALGVAVLASITTAWIAVPLWVIAILLLAWGLQPKLVEQYARRLPYGGSYILKALGKLDSTLSRWS